VALTAYPFDDQDTTETEYSRLFRELQDSGVADSNGGPGFAVSANASAMTVRVQAGFAIVRGHAVLSTGVETVLIPAADPAARIDRVVLRLDPSLDSIVLAVVKGTPSGGVPALTQTDTGVYELGLARVTVDPSVGSISADKVFDERPFVGSRVGAWTTATRPVNPRLAQLGFNTSLLSWEYWTGTGWTGIAPTVEWTSVAGKPAAFTPVPHQHDWNAEVTGKPGTFPPTGHPHNAADLDNGTVAFARLPTGTGSAQVAAGNHAHAWGAITGKPGTFPPSSHSHAAPTTVSRANGSDRVHGNSPAGSGWYSVWVDGNHNFCHNTSSIRYKRNVRDAALDPNAVLALQPRVYDRRDTTDDGVTTPGRTDEFGLIAEEVAEHLPQLVIHDEHGQIDALRYDLLAVAMIPLLRRQQDRIADLERRLDQLIEDLAPCVAPWDDSE